MGMEVIDSIGRHLLHPPWVNESVVVAWHAGEPLMAGMEFYEDALSRLSSLAEHGLRLRHAIQTNGMLINDEWIDLFRRWDMHIGLSLDGPPHIHDAMRVDRAGRGTAAAALKGLQRLTAAKLPFEVITVLTHNSLDFPEELFHFYLENSISSVAFNVEEIEGPHLSSTLEHPDAVQRFRCFLERFWDLVDRHPGALSVREIKGAISAILNMNSVEPTNPLADPLDIISVDAEGNMSTFAPELLSTHDPRLGSFIFGNVRDGGPEQFLSNPNYLIIKDEIAAGIKACRQSCNWFPLCGGGSPSNKLFETGRLDTSETLYCRLGHQTLLDVALNRLENSLEASIEAE